MELNPDLIGIQGLLISLNKSIAPLSKIRRKGGKEEVVSKVVQEFKNFLSGKKIWNNNGVSESFEDKIKEIILFLLLNTDLNFPITNAEYGYLSNIAPNLSKCLFSNIITELNLFEYFCDVVLPLSIQLIEELLREMENNIKNGTPQRKLETIYLFTKLTIEKLSDMEDTKKEGEAEKLIDLICYLLISVTSIEPNQAEQCGINFIYQMLGQTLYKLLKLLLQCDINQLNLSRIIVQLISSCSTITMGVTLNVFCYWAEIEDHGISFQTVVCEEAYLFIEKYQKYKLAKDLVGHLGSFARKPLNLKEKIQSADVPTTISMIDKADSNQKSWFNALLNTKVFKNADSMQCVDRWALLCTLENITKLLNDSIEAETVEAKRIAVKCASILSVDHLIIASVQHFYNNGFEHNLADDILQQIILIFNKLKDQGDEINKELVILLLQNPRQVFNYVFGECLKSSFYTEVLKTFLNSIKEIARINHLGLETLLKQIDENVANQTVSNYKNLFNSLVEMHFFATESIYMEIYLPLIQKALSQDDYKNLKFWLEIINDMEHKVLIKPETESLFCTLLNIMRQYRCKLHNFNISKQEVVRGVVDVMEKYCDPNNPYLCTFEDYDTKDDDSYVYYYKERLFRNVKIRFLAAIAPKCNVQNHAEVVTYFIKFLPSCVKQEWFSICDNLISYCGIRETGEIFTHYLILLCHYIVNEETGADERICMINALKYNLQNFGNILQKFILPRIESLDEEKCIIEKICRLLKEIPEDVLPEEGLLLANLVPERSLKSLKNDKCLIYSISLIKELQIRKMLAEKMMG